MTCQAREVLNCISRFKIAGWTNLSSDQIKVSKIGHGYVNTTLKIEKLLPGVGHGPGPTCLLVKMYGGNVMDSKELVKPNSPMIQSFVFHEQSIRGWGPRLYGLMEDGRVEEFVDCHTLKAEEAFSLKFSRDVARAYARFHSLQLPIKKVDFDMMAEIMSSFAENKKELHKFIQSSINDRQEVILSFKKLYDFSIQEESDWLNSIRKKVTERVVLATMDPIYLNRLVRSENPSGPEKTRTLLIDYDFTAYSNRGYDLGGHFVERVFNWAGQETKVSGFPYPSEAERTSFLSYYLEECEKVFDDFDKSSLDSLENVTLEADLNALVYLVTGFAFILTLHKILDEDPNIFTTIDPSLLLYRELKDQFYKKYPNLVK